MKAAIIEAKDGDPIVVFPPGLEIDATYAQLEQDGARVVITPLARDGDETDSED